ncbi:MAG: GNAT family N-acetyltransferase [Clostridiales bacterium]|nr:GNAT family N-acetyltransferase [Clostridiales bacterium]
MRKLETDRLILRPWQISDIEDFYEYAKNPNVGPAAGWEPHKDILTTGHILQQFLNKDEVWALVYKENGRVIGSLGVHNDDKRKGVRARMVGYALSEEYWGRGIMTEAVKEVIRYMFENAGFDVLSCYHYPFNDRSRRVIEKSGFRYDGTLRHASMVFDGKTYDDVCYSITRSEWNFEREAGI